MQKIKKSWLEVIDEYRAMAEPDNTPIKAEEIAKFAKKLKQDIKGNYEQDRRN